MKDINELLESVKDRKTDFSNEIELCTNIICDIIQDEFEQYYCNINNHNEILEIEIEFTRVDTIDEFGEYLLYEHEHLREPVLQKVLHTLEANKFKVYKVQTGLSSYVLNIYTYPFTEDEIDIINKYYVYDAQCDNSWISTLIPTSILFLLFGVLVFLLNVESLKGIATICFWIPFCELIVILLDLRTLNKCNKYCKEVEKIVSTYEQKYFVNKQ